MADFKGGRGKKAGYATQMYRIPTPLRPTVEALGMQFRLLWDGLVDPTGTKLISRIERAIPDPDQLSDSDGQNQISGKPHISISDIKYQELEDKLAGCQHNCSELQRENRRLLADQARADAAIGELRLQLEEQKLEIEQLAQLERDGAEQLSLEVSNHLKAATALKEALKLKANAGGQIKAQIRYALHLIDDL